MNETSTCPQCNETKPLSEFYKDSKRPIGVTSWCKLCTKKRTKERYDRDSESFKKAHKKWVEKNKDKVKIQKITSKYKITEEEYNNIEKICVICGSTDNLRIDHNHNSGRVRGMLCDHCNKGLGFFRDNPSLLLRASDYVLGHATPDIFRKEDS